MASPAMATRVSRRMSASRGVLAWMVANDRSTGRFLAFIRPRRVTFWVDYAMVDGKAVVHNAYSHRMMVYGTSNEARQ